MPSGGTRGRGRGRGGGTPRARKSRKKNMEEPPMMYPPQLQDNTVPPPMPPPMPPMEAEPPLTYPDPSDEPIPEPEEDEEPPVLEPCNAPSPLPPESSVFNFTEDDEPPPPLHGDGYKKGKAARKPRKPREPKVPKEPKPPKEPKTPKEAKPPKTPKTKSPRKKRDSKISPDSTEKGKRKSPKKKPEEGEEEEQSEVVVEEEEEEAVEGVKEEPTDTEPTEEEEEGVKSEAESEVPLKASPSPKKSKKDKRSKGRPSRSAKSSSKDKKRKSKTSSQVLEAENDDLAASDGEDSNKRRSARNTQRKKYMDDIMLTMSDDESKGSSPKLESKQQSPDSVDSPVVKPNFVYINTSDEDSMVVQYILAVRKGRREMKEVPKSQSDTTNDKESTADDQQEEVNVDAVKEDKSEMQVQTAKEPELDSKLETTELGESQTKIVDVEEYYVKYRNFSYLHCEWKTEEELYKGDKRIAAKLKRFKQKMAHHANIFENLEEDPFNPDYVEVDRVLDMAEHTDPNTNKSIKHYLVKWRSLQYEDSTWELEEDIDPIKIQQYHKFNKLPPKDQWKPKKKPAPTDWEKLEESPIYKNENSLRAYQLEGLNWLLFSWYNGRNCILADEMGLGKTIQSLTFINAVREYGIRGPFLVIAPLSTIPNWQREFEAWTDLNVIVYHGSAASRNMLQEYEMFYKNDKGNFIKDLPKFNVLITTFEIIITDFQDLRDFHWRLCVIDEAHRLKNRNCKLLEGLRTLNLEHRVLLSGTPLQNNVNELFSLLNFLEPQQFSSSDAFLQEFGALKTENEVQKLQLLLKPMMLRRLKEDVEKTIAPKEETVVEVELTNIQKKYYRGILERNFSFLSKGTTSANVPNLMNTMMELRKCCIHPYLLNGAEDQIQHDFRVAHGDDPDAYYKALINSSGKMVLIDKLLPKLKAGGHRVLVFSQMVRCLDILEDYLVYRKYPFERIDGRIRGNLRQAAIDRFCRPDSDRFVFLLCTKAGGLGINLTAADTVIIYDSDWNPQNDLQAQARCHRIGQQKMVKVYRLLCRNTYEREMFDKASLKLGLDKAVLQSMNTTQGGKEIGNKQLSKKEIEDLLKKGAYGAIMDEDSAADKFCEEDIDQILERRTQIITLESEKGSTFSKASFTSSGIRADIDIDDPDFWHLWAKRADIDTAERGDKNELVISEPRRRTQIKRYGHDENTLMSDLSSSSGDEEHDDNDTAIGVGRGRGGRKHRKLKKLKQKFFPDDFVVKEGEVTYGAWSRSECFKVERGLLTFGWGRWSDILSQGQFRDGWRESDVEDVARIIMLYCLRYYRGDDKIRSFIWDLITPMENGESSIPRNHMGLHSPVPRGGRRKMKLKMKEAKLLGQTSSEPQEVDHWSRNDKYDGDIFLESNYRKHLARHANKVLLRVRMLYYLKHEILGELVHHISDGQHASALPIYPPHCDQAPAPWWDRDADRSLVVGTYKHGYENYSQMRGDPALSFLARCGPPTHHSEEKELGKLSDEEEGGSETTGGEPPSGPATPTPTPTEGEGPTEEQDPNKPQWPSMQDLNSRLRKVITSYQRNFKKEEMKLAQKAKPLEPHAAAVEAINQQLGTNWDWHQLAMYLWKVERREKYEQVIKERERQRLENNQRKWSRREEQDFYRTISTFGVEFDKQKNRFDWNKFRAISRLDKKLDDTMTDYYKAFIAMCKRVCCVKLSEEEECTELYVEPLPEDKARRTLEKINLLSKIREEILPHPQLDERLRLCQVSADVPEWWLPGKHDKDLLLGVAKHGLGRTDFFILNDPELSFREIVHKNMNMGVVKSEQQNALKLERPEDILKLDRNEIVVKLEKGEGTLKIEKIGSTPLKIEPSVDKTLSVKEEKSDLIEETVKQEALEPAGEVIGAEEVGLIAKNAGEATSGGNEEADEASEEVKAAEEVSSGANEEAGEASTEVNDVSTEAGVEKTETPQDQQQQPSSEARVEDCTKQEAEPVTESEMAEPAVVESEKQELSEVKSEGNTEVVDRFKAMFPELEVMQRLPEIDTTVVAEKQSTIAQLLQQSYQNPIKWPKDHALQVRLQHIVHCVEHKEWPVSRMFSAYSGGVGGEEPTDTATPPRPVSTEGSEVITITTDMASRSAHQLPAKRKRHIAIDVETERAKLHALLNSTNMQMSHMMKHSPAAPWDDESLSEDSRRSTPVTQLQPPPAHQQSHQSPRVLSMPFDLKFHTPAQATPAHTPKPHSPAPSSLTLTPIDLSASVPKSAHTDSMRASSSRDVSSAMDQVQDFSMPSKNKQPQQTKSKLDDMLSKLMQRKNCPVPVEEPVVGKEKKRRKLDEIVLGLSAAKEQQEPKKSASQREPSVSLTAVSKAMTTSGKSSFLAQAEQHNLLLKQQQQLQQQLLQQQQQALKLSQPNSASAAHVQRKTYEAMIADISKVADFSAKISSYSHEAKVNKWLAEQTSMIPDQSLGADFMSAPRRRRPRVDPTLLDWKKLTGEENVSVINRMTGKKLTGNKAPQLKRLAQWLLENPMYDVDPKWAELVKERGNLPHDLQKRLPQSERKKGPGRPPLLNSPPQQTPSSQASSSSLPTGNLAFPSLGGINPTSLLSGLSLGGFDPKNNPLLMPFGGMPNMSALGGMSGLGNMGLTNSLFANLASLGLPSLAGLDSSSLANPATSSPSSSSDTKAAKSHKAENKASTKAPVSSASSTLPTSLPFFFPNPSLLYTPLGLGGLNPFSLQPGSISSAYDSLALLNGSLGVNATQAQSRTHKSSTSSTTSVPSGRATTVTSAAASQSKQQQRLPAQFLLPHDTHLLESLTRSSKPKQPKASLYSREQEMREALETLSKSSTELLPRLPQEDKVLKRTREEAFQNPAAVDLIASKQCPSPLPKKSRESPVPPPSPVSKLPTFSSGLDLTNHLVLEERTKTPPPPPLLPQPTPPLNENALPFTKGLMEESPTRPLSPEDTTTQESSEPLERAEEEREMGDEEPNAGELTSDAKDESGEGDGEGSNGGKSRKRRGKKSVDVGQRKMLRSSAGRAAAAAAARARDDHSN